MASEKFSSAIISDSDKTELEIKVYLPSERDIIADVPFRDDLKPFKLAILLHPYGPLGGSMHDPVINALASSICQLGFIVATPNMRGVLNSSGKTSWTGRAECEDLASMVKAFVIEGKRDMWFDNVLSEKLPNLQEYACSEILILGYSYGSLIASSFNLNSLKAIFSECSGGVSSGKEVVPKLSTVLLSYPVSVAWALSLWKKWQFSKELETLVDEANSKSLHQGHEKKSRLLIVFSCNDQFSSLSSYNSWIENMKIQKSYLSLDELDYDKVGKEVHAVYCKEADHFWRSSRLLGWLSKEITFWLKARI